MIRRATRSPRAWLSVVVTFGLLVSLSARVVAAPDPRELKAREEFGAGRYEKALDIFAKLYAETLNPIYLRNVGRCYQNLGQPDRAITSFHEYLRKAKGLKPDDRAEIDGYINEMQELKKQQEQAAAARPPAVPAAAPVTSVPAVVPPSETSPPPGVAVTAAPPSVARVESPPIYAKWWFWAIVAGAVGAGVGVAAAAGAFTHTVDAPCTTGFQCGP
jgi:tetratricopeptide (TPR) repeat protein